LNLKVIFIYFARKTFIVVFVSQFKKWQSLASFMVRITKICFNIGEMVETHAKFLLVFVTV
jgi:hypothetical protein